MPTDTHRRLRNLPSVDKLLADPRVVSVGSGLLRELLVDIVRQVLDESRRSIIAGSGAGDSRASLDDIVQAISLRVSSLGESLRQVINATGVVLHTNLGRAPMSNATIEAMAAASRGFINLELDMETGKRGSRLVHIEPLLCLLTGAEAAMVVNNNAAAVLLGLTALAKGREVIVSRGQAVQIGGGVRIPEIMRQSGAKLVEVGTTNVTEAADYANAITAKTAALLKVHSSNFKVVGFTKQVGLDELVSLARERKLQVLDDLGSGCLIDTTKYGLAAEPMVQESIALGSDLVFFSGDKLLGGPQAGLIVGKRDLVDRLKRHPLARAMRIDRTRLAGLVVTLMHYVRGEAEKQIPVWRMISLDLSSLEDRARRWASLIKSASVEQGESLIGGGSLPGSTLPTWLVTLKEPARSKEKKVIADLARRLRVGSPSVVCRIEKDRLLFDPRTVLPEEEQSLLAALGRGTQESLAP